MITVNRLRAFAAGIIAVMLAPTAVAWTQTGPSFAGSMVGVTEIDNTMDERLAEQISQASIGGKVMSAAQWSSK
jgi:hypothetical protein